MTIAVYSQGARTGVAHDRARQSGENYVAIGQRLIEAKAMLKHGEFVLWLEEEIGIKATTARNMMRVAERFKTANFAGLKPAALIALSSGKVPDSARQEAIDRAQAGENVTAEAAREIAAAHANDAADSPASAITHAREPPASTAAASVDEVKDIRDKAEAVRLYAKQAGMSLEAQNRCAEIKLRAERKVGELLRDMPKNPGGRSTCDTLSQVGVERHQSSRWQKLASIPADEFEGYITDTLEAGRELTTAGAINNQWARRNLTPEQERFLLGRKYTEVYGGEEGQGRPARERQRGKTNGRKPPIRFRQAGHEPDGEADRRSGRRLRLHRQAGREVRRRR